MYTPLLWPQWRLIISSLWTRQCRELWHYGARTQDIRKLFSIWNERWCRKKYKTLNTSKALLPRMDTWVLHFPRKYAICPRWSSIWTNISFFTMNFPTSNCSSSKIFTITLVLMVRITIHMIQRSQTILWLRWEYFSLKNCWRRVIITLTVIRNGFRCSKKDWRGLRCTNNGSSGSLIRSRNDYQLAKIIWGMKENITRIKRCMIKKFSIKKQQNSSNTE